MSKEMSPYLYAPPGRVPLCVPDSLADSGTLPQSCRYLGIQALSVKTLELRAGAKRDKPKGLRNKVTIRQIWKLG